METNRTPIPIDVIGDTIFFENRNISPIPIAIREIIRSAIVRIKNTMLSLIIFSTMPRLVPMYMSYI